MSRESDEELYRLIYEHASKEEKKVKRDKNQKEAIRRRLEEAARSSLDAYGAECLEVRPEAEAKLREVIQPWWRGLEEEGIITQLRRYLSLRKWDFFPLSDRIRHWWPVNLRRSWAVSSITGDKPFTWEAQWVSEYTPGQKREQETSRAIGSYKSKEYWLGEFSPGVKNQGDLTLWREPARGYGCGFRHSSYWTHLSLSDPNSFFEDAHPITVVEFAAQIVKGRALEKIREGFHKGS